MATLTSNRELIQRDDVIVKRENKCILVTNPKIPEKQDGDSRQRIRRFAVDFCYDPKDPETCSQQAVYKEIGSEVLDSMFEGYNACVLAYGHSASGKTYTMMGLQDDPGLTPRICQGLFDRIERKSSSVGIKFQILISFLEIYNEKVRDLLGAEEAATSTNFSLRVREHPKLGPYVQDLSHHLISDRRKLLEYLSVGNKRRSTAATENNIHSSRSHAVFTIRFKQTDEEVYETDKSSKVHLVDLAGSLQEVSQKQKKYTERASTSQSKTRLKEGANINKSLVTLGNVISALAENYESLPSAREHSKTWQPFVPYRDSVLTWLLKDTLGGNSNTIMIATISPASSCLNETINTLRYAKRTKRIVNQPIINEDPKIRTIRELREEVTKLRTLLMSFQLDGTGLHLKSNVNNNNNNNFKVDTDNAATQNNNVEYKIREKFAGSNISSSKCQDSGGTQFTINEDFSRRDDYKTTTEKNPLEVDINEGETSSEDVEESSILEKKGLKRPEKNTGREEFGRKPNSAHIFVKPPSLDGGDACKINAEKKSDVNGSVIDSVPRDQQIFSDSLESFPSLAKNVSDAEDSETDANAADLEGFAGESGRILARPCLSREFSSCENLSQRDPMLHRNRPDLIRGISARSKDGIPSTSSQSCTDISNLSQSTSENSLNSSGSVDAQPTERRLSQGSARKASADLRTKSKETVHTNKKPNKSEIVQIPADKKDKRSEIVEAVTSRLYVTKKKSDRRLEATRAAEKEENDDDGELEELKLCKRARMKLFDLSRKLAMTRKLKKTVDNDTQTDFRQETVRVKEKCVVTDQRGLIKFEDSGTSIVSSEENAKDKSEPYVIMNQVFIPQSSNYVVECGKGVRIEVPGTLANKHDLATQTKGENKSYENANTSPIKFQAQGEDCFSDDSLDLEDKRNREDASSVQAQGPLGNVTRLHHRSYDSLVRQEKILQNTEKLKRHSSECLGTENAQMGVRMTLFDGLSLSASAGNEFSSGETQREEFPLTSNSNLSRKEEMSSENSFASLDSTDVASSSETSSEDFVFYESCKDKDSIRGKVVSDRELYTITENSEQSDPSGATSPASCSLTHLEVSPLEATCFATHTSVFQTDSPCKCRQICEKVDKYTQVMSRHDARPCDLESTFLYSKPCKRDVQQSGTSDASVRDSEPLECSRSKLRSLEVPKFGFFPAYNCNPVKVPKVANSRGSPFEETATTNTNNHKSEPASESSDGTTTKPNFSKPRKVNWTDFLRGNQRQFLNLNIMSSSAKTEPPFTVDTNLFSETSKRNQSTETMFASEESITFVFMGPAKPKTSVLMEIIKRSLDQNLSISSKKSKSRGVQCDSKLTRSVSMDTALIALSRIAKNQRPSADVQRTTSLDTLVPDEMQAILERGRIRGVRESGCQCDLETELPKVATLKYSVCTTTTRDQETETVEEKAKTVEERSKPKKCVSWSGETKPEKEKDCNRQDDAESTKADNQETPDFHLSYCDSSEVEVEESNVTSGPILDSSDLDLCAQGRRVRFSKSKKWNPVNACQTINQKREAVQSADEMSDMLKEAMELLRNLNYVSNNCEMSAEEVLKQVEVTQTLKNEEKRRGEAKGVTKWSSKYSEGAEVKRVPEIRSVLRSRTPLFERKREEESVNLTWPRRRTVISATGKPPTGLPKCLRYPRSSSSDFSYGISEIAGNCSQSSRAGSISTNWNASNLSTSFSNSYAGDIPSRPSSSRSVHSNCCKCSKDFSFSSSRSTPRTASPRLQVAKPNFDTLVELQLDLEESCRRLESVVEQDRRRQESLENNTRFRTDELFSEIGYETDVVDFAGSPVLSEKPISTESAKRRKTFRCTNTCICEDFSPVCRSPPSRSAYRSTFELDSFGPGSQHCRQRCMFCRKKELEIYRSTPILNSECCSNRCRLRYYGYCPCSPVRLPQVASSPRAYMQHLLTLRREIVRSTRQT